ncbi:hypothetical protein HJG54_09745 [Leptolyngbya sp. NK1-12]|uniref:Uncharacterized protein n=1 Tax=Leptolyngbya sp. NK1-12 TaxID=2547451 RepID=A0AA97AFF5_9CYAN|nr:hypothetical protein [Leptolyngbya sp. NK1-12]WNZ23115.1 hypothetical protein HJG54_09745 [Leptolyngbya sp. NK1-12]
MNVIRVLNLCGGFLFGCGLLVGINAIARQHEQLSSGTILNAENVGNGGALIDSGENEQLLINLMIIQTGVGAALVCLREKSDK